MAPVGLTRSVIALLTRLDPATLWAAIAALASLATVTLSLFLVREAQATTRELHQVVARLSETSQSEKDAVAEITTVVGSLEQVAQLLRRETAESMLLDRLT